MMHGQKNIRFIREVTTTLMIMAKRTVRSEMMKETKEGIMIMGITKMGVMSGIRIITRIMKFCLC